MPRMLASTDSQMAVIGMTNSLDVTVQALLSAVLLITDLRSALAAGEHARVVEVVDTFHLGYRSLPEPVIANQPPTLIEALEEYWSAYGTCAMLIERLKWNPDHRSLDEPPFADAVQDLLNALARIVNELVSDEA